MQHGLLQTAPASYRNVHCIVVTRQTKTYNSPHFVQNVLQKRYTKSFFFVFRRSISSIWDNVLKILTLNIHGQSTRRTSCFSCESHSMYRHPNVFFTSSRILDEKKCHMRKNLQSNQCGSVQKTIFTKVASEIFS